MKNKYFILFILITLKSFSQGIIVDTTSLSIPQLIRTVLMPNSCSNETNFVFSSRQGIGKFTNTNPIFPFPNGIIIRNGVAKYTEGPYTGLNLSSQLNNSGDPNLQVISNSSLQTGAITDVGFIQFDFTPISSSFSFDFVFASNEYGQYQCGFSDVFAFILTDLTTNIQTNLAVIPSTTTPVSVKNIRDSAYNSSCTSNNPSLFARYNVANPLASAINMKGETVLLNASSPVIPNRTYRIKLAIGDYFDGSYDSAVFIKGGSFTTYTDLGPDLAICQGENVVLTSGINPPYTVSWTLNGNVIPGQNGTTLTVNQPGTYGVIGTLPNSGCQITDEVIISNLTLRSFNNLSVCNSGAATYQYDLSQNNISTLGLNPAEYSILYFDSLTAANANSPQIPANQITSYTSAGGQTIYVKVMHLTNGNYICSNLLSFDLLVNAPFSALSPNNIPLCADANGSTTIDLTGQNNLILNGQLSADYTISYFSSQADAQNNINPIPTPTAFITTLAQSPQTVWVRMNSVINPRCFDVTSFTITVFPKPLVDSIPSVIECHSYFLPVITNGNYYTGSNGTGTMLHAGDEILVPGTYYIFSGPTAQGCINESSFTITLVDQLVFPLSGCGVYIIPSPVIGNFYTGPGGTGTQLAGGSSINSNQTIYYYAVINSVVCRDEAFNISVFPLPAVDTLQNVITCNSYALPTIVNGGFYTMSGGQGANLVIGSPINSSQTVYIYSNDGRCSNETSFSVTIIDTSIFTTVISCGSFSLPAITIGNYYTQPMGAGTIIPAGTSITSSQVVYYYAPTTTTPNCTDLLNYNITILPLPIVDAPANRLECESYVLPALTNGNYFSSSGGVGPLNAGDVISSNQTLFVYGVSNLGCTLENSFTITIRQKPVVDILTDVFACSDFTLPPLTNGNYYTAPNGPNGTGSLIPFGTIINTSQRIYIYNAWPDFPSCSNESYFNFDYSAIDVGTYSDVNACDRYTLPPLSITGAGYYSQPNGVNPLAVGTVITSSQRVYVYKKVGTRLTCSDEADFMVNISNTPFLPNFANVSGCGNYILGALPPGANYFSGPNGTGTSYTIGQSITNTQQIYVYSESPTNSSCYNQQNFTISIFPFKNLLINGGAICVDNVTGTLIQSCLLTSGLNPINYTVNWYLNGVLMGTGPNYNAVQEGTYDVIILKNTPIIGPDCGYNPTTVTVLKSSAPIANLIVSGVFDDIINITVNVTGGYGNYEFQLDNGSFQSDPNFYDVPSGMHTINIKDTKGNCSRISLIAHIIKYPNYFTPNGDSYHDTWNISDLSFQSDAYIYIYDRYGKFIKELKTNGPGWDGNLNGNPLPSSDYWFQVFYNYNNSPQVFKSHFSLKR